MKNQSDKKTRYELYHENFKGGHIDCITEAEQFYEDDLYSAVFSVTREIERNGLQAKLEKLARNLGGTGLVQMFRKNCTAKKREIKENQEREQAESEQRLREMELVEREHKMAEGNLSKFTNLPEGCKNMYIGERWRADDDGIYMLEEHGKSIRKIDAARFPFLIECLYEPYDAGAMGTEKCGIRYKNTKGAWKRKVVEQSTLMNAQKVLSLSESGMVINSRRALPFTDFATSMIEESSMRGAIPIHKMASSFGWTSDGKEFLPYTSNEVIFDKEDQFPGLVRALTQPQGDREEWYKVFKEMRKTRVKMFHFATIVLLASPILGMLPDVVNGFVGNVYGDSHVGKTINDSICATIWGDYKSDYVVAAKGTLTGMEVRMDVLKNIPFIIEDANNADPNSIPGLIMQVSNGAGALRATKTLGNRAQMAWCLSMLANSEAIITSYGNNGGINGGAHTRVYACQAESRFPEIWKDRIGNWKQFFANNYGFAGRDFVKILQRTGVEKLQQMRTECMKKILTRTAELHHSQAQAEGLAILMMADKLAADELFGDGIRFSIDELISLTADEKTIKPAKRFYSKLEDKMSCFPDRFEGLNSSLTDKIVDDENPTEWKGEFWGIYMVKNNERWLAINSLILDKWLAEGGVDKHIFFSYLRENKLLDADAGGNTKKIYSRTQKERKRLVKIKLGNVIQEGEDEDIPFN